MLPKKCNLPNLTMLDNLFDQLSLRIVFSNEDATLGKVAIYRKIYIRLMDKALKEYCFSREALIAQVEEQKRTPEEMIETGRIIYMFSFSDHMENCIHTIRRMLRIIERVKSTVDNPGIPRTMRKLIDSFSTQVVHVRDTIEHIDEKIQKDEIGDNEPVMLKLGGDSDQIEIGNYVLKLHTLVSLIKNLHNFAKEMFFWTDSALDKKGNS